MLRVHDYEKRYAETFAITKIRVFKCEPFFFMLETEGWEGGGGGGVISNTLRYMCVCVNIVHQPSSTGCQMGGLSPIGLASAADRGGHHVPDYPGHLSHTPSLGERAK